MKKEKYVKNVAKAILLCTLAAVISLHIAMPPAQASVCPIYGNSHRYIQHYNTGSGYTDTSQHTYVYYQIGNTQYSSSCVYTRYHGYFYPQCPCNATNSGTTCDHVYLEYHPGTAPGQPNGCASGNVSVSLPTH